MEVSFFYILKIEMYMLCKTKSYRQIIEPASKPIENLDNRLTLEGFRAWYEEGKKMVFDKTTPKKKKRGCRNQSLRQSNCRSCRL